MKKQSRKVGGAQIELRAKVEEVERIEEEEETGEREAQETRESLLQTDRQIKQSNKQPAKGIETNTHTYTKQRDPTTNHKTRVVAHKRISRQQRNNTDVEERRERQR